VESRLSIGRGHDRLSSVAFYLPQFHPVPENDRWWGAGFSEWHNVVRAKPLFPGHYQPHLPADLGFYDLRLPETSHAQAQLASEYRVEGFCYYHYWFHGERLLSAPLDRVLQSGQPSFPFMLCWANENWTRSWDGGASTVLMEQRYSAEDDIEHARWLGAVFQDDRYIRIDGRPALLVYRAYRLPAAPQTVERWRRVWESMGIAQPYLAAVESFPDELGDPAELGFDGVVAFAPQWARLPLRFKTNRVLRMLAERRVIPAALGHSYADYTATALRAARRPNDRFERVETVTPGWDNTPRRRSGGLVLCHSRPAEYGRWVELASERALLSDGPSLIMVNAWNEWAEGAHLEPDRRYGHAYLQAHRQAVERVEATRNRSA
jgi:lipopolysaccharide biosynthesis protein